jgi:hypothetical protein
MVDIKNQSLLHACNNDLSRKSFILKHSNSIFSFMQSSVEISINIYDLHYNDYKFGFFS